jgi:hypothetical protein
MLRWAIARKLQPLGTSLVSSPESLVPIPCLLLLRRDVRDRQIPVGRKNFKSTLLLFLVSLLIGP